jgi:hypothetical protein
MRTSFQVALSVLVIYAIANILYFAKSASGIDILPGHHGGYFPLGQWLWHLSKHW